MVDTIPTALADPASSARPPTLAPLPLGSIRAAGWLAERIERQLHGMAGRLDEHWPSIRDSSWIGGQEDGWERGPYWLDGVVPLAALTDDAALMGKVDRWIDSVLDRQDASGWMGPHHGDMQGTADDPHDTDVWPRMPLLKALLQYHDATGDPRIVPAAHRLALRIGEVIAQEPLRSWGYYRVADLVLSLHELHRRTGDDRMLAIAGAALTQGYRWDGFVDEMPIDKVTGADIARWRDEEGVKLAGRTMLSHGVNVAMGWKWMAAAWLLGGPDELRGSFNHLLAALDRHHGQVTGLFSTDEHLGGLHPSQGTETCAVVEAMYSLECALEAWGLDEALAARLERIAFNALPAAATADDLGHQYDQQANQVACRVVEDPIYTDNGPDSNTFGLEPNFGCCTANRHQGWPKFTARLWMRDTDDGGLTALSYAPATIIDRRDGGDLTVEVGGDYPFGEDVRITVSADRSTRRPLHLRVPGWAESATLSSADGRRTRLRAGSVHTVEEEWGPEAVTLVLHLPAPVRVRGTDPVSVESGPLLLVLPVEEHWTVLRDHGWMQDQEVLPAGPWARGLVTDGLDGTARMRRTTANPAAGPFTPDGAPIGVPVRVRDVGGWALEHGAAAAPPSPASAAGGAEPAMLIPYGAARLRVTVLPRVPAD